ncbi:MAG: hypothetical protein H6734_14895 [Alphaproteobacteria bacterium]|nr:hypothetical protein [Alphaproteobacteria bacterium]
MVLLLAACVHHAPGGPMTKSGTFDVRLEAGTGTEVTMTVVNTGPDRGTFCTYHTPFEGIRNDIFVVERDGRELDYRGMMAKRAPPGPEDFRTVAAGGSVGPVTVDLSRGYALGPGTWSVRYRGTGISGLPDSNPVELVVP